MLCLVFKFSNLIRNNSHAGWKEAISSNHVKLVVSRHSEVQDCEVAAYQSSNVDRNSLANAENWLPTNSGVTKSFKTKIMPKKGTKIKYIPKQKAAT